MKIRIWLCAYLFREICGERSFLNHITQKKKGCGRVCCIPSSRCHLGEQVAECAAQQGMVPLAQLTVHSEFPIQSTKKS